MRRREISLALLDRDLCDSRHEAARSVLEALGSLGDPKAFTHVARLLAGADPAAALAGAPSGTG